MTYNVGSFYSGDTSRDLGVLRKWFAWYQMICRRHSFLGGEVPWSFLTNPAGGGGLKNCEVVKRPTVGLPAEYLFR